MSMSAACGCSPKMGFLVFSCACPARLQRFNRGTASSSMTWMTCSTRNHGQASCLPFNGYTRQVHADVRQDM